MKRERTMTKRQRRNVSNQFEDLGQEAHQLMKLAAESLGLTSEQVAAAENDVTEASDMIQVRVIEMLELVHGGTTPDAAAALAEIERRRGAGFLQRVAATGRSAKAAALALLSVLAILATGAVPTTQPGAGTSHKIHGVNSRGLLARVRRLLQNAPWLRNGSCGGWPRRSTGGGRRRSSSGRRCASTSSVRRGSRQRSSSGSTSKRSAHTNSSAQANQSTPSDEPPGPSSVRQTRPFLLLRSASCIAKSASAFAVGRGRP